MYIMLFFCASQVNATSRVDQLLSNMSTRQKFTQMLMADFRYWDVQIIGHEFTEMNDQVRKIVEDYDFGALIYRNGRNPHLNMKYRWGMNADDEFD